MGLPPSPLCTKAVQAWRPELALWEQRKIERVFWGSGVRAGRAPGQGEAAVHSWWPAGSDSCWLAGGCDSLLGQPQARMGSAPRNRVSPRALDGQATSLGAVGARRDGAFCAFAPGARALEPDALH